MLDDLIANIIWHPSDPGVPLAAVLRRLARDAEEMFDADNVLPMMWLVEVPGRGQATICTPVVGEDFHATKTAIAEMMRELFAKLGVTRYAVASEAWITDDGGRWECIVIHAEDSREALSAIREIHRPANGEAYLAKLDIQPQKKGGMSKFGNLLPGVQVH